MNFLPLIDQPLKSPEVVDVLECHDMEVVYDFDRLFEGTEDRYHSSSTQGGFEFVFDSAQRLATVFLYITPSSGIAAIDAGSLDVPVYASVDAARHDFERGGGPIKQGDGWIKTLEGRIWRHYEFRDGNLSMITLTRDLVLVTPEG